MADQQAWTGRPTRRRGRRAGVAAAAVAAVALAGCDLGAPPVRHELPGGLVDVVDVDGDGHLDLVAADDGAVHVRPGDGAGGFGPTASQPRVPCGDDQQHTTCSPAAVTLADADGDGHVDMLESYRTSVAPPPPGTPTTRWVVTVRLNDGGGTFAAPVTTAGDPAPEAAPAPSASFADVTGDDRVDLLLTDAYTADPRRVAVRPGDGTGAFGAPTTTAFPVRNLGDGVVVAHLDGDGHADLALAGGCAPFGPGEAMFVGCVIVLFGDGTGAFPRHAHVQVADDRADGLTVDVADVDGDAHLDLVAGRFGIDVDGGARSGGLSTFLGDGLGGFGPELVSPGPEQVYGLQATDIDGDDVPDVLVSSQGEDYALRGHVLFGDGAGGVAATHRIGTGRELIADLDEDGAPDLVAGEPGRVAVYLNRWNAEP